jgi:hypothetical protein
LPGIGMRRATICSSWARNSRERCWMTGGGSYDIFAGMPVGKLGDRPRPRVWRGGPEG